MDKASITRDLQEFHHKGIGAVLLVCSGNWGAGPIPSGPEFLSEEWRELFIHALNEAERLNIKVDAIVWIPFKEKVAHMGPMKCVIQQS